MTLSALIFDVDGTLAETEECHRQAFNLAFQGMGLGWNWDPAHYLELLSVTGGKERIRHYAEEHDTAFLNSRDADHRIMSIHQRKTNYYIDLIRSGGINLRPGIERLIEDALCANVRIAIATTTTRSNVEILLTSTLGARGPELFDVISASDSADRKKPSPDIYYDVLEKLQCGPEESIAFEDSQNGLLAARRAGVETVITLSPFTSCDDHMDALAVLSDLGEPDQACEVIRGNLLERHYIDLEILLEWREQCDRLLEIPSRAMSV